MTVTTFAVEISYTAQIPADQLTEMVGEERDSEQWRESAGRAAEQWARENVEEALRTADGPDVGWLW